MRIKLKRYYFVLCFMLFFVLFLSLSRETAFAKSETSVTSTPTETPLEIKLNVKSKTLVKEKTYTLKVYNVTDTQKVTYKSSADNIASVDSNGTITGVAIGTATITVTVKEGQKVVSTLQCEITVGPPAISVKWTKSEILLVVGKRTTLKTILQPYNTAEEIKFTSYDTSIATVSTGGRVTAKSAGTTYIYALLDNGKFDTCKVTVVDEETYQKMLEEQKQTSESTSGK
ncbi:MAG: Ig domain-containing protein [Lachnospiraceae bacterium]|nr:Ig domain-containing protein [Lachnospiraceae bacterium]